MASDDFLSNLFKKIDTDSSGQLSPEELQRALSNGTWTPFNPETIRLMIVIFDGDKSGGIDYREFVALWKYITSWQSAFVYYDKDKSGAIDHDELRQALVSFGYRLSESFFRLMTSKYGRHHRGQITFDDFILCCVTMQILTNAFKQLDTDRDGWITVSFEQFLTMVMGSII